MKLQWVRERNRGHKARNRPAVVAAKDGDVNPACQTGVVGAGVAQHREGGPAARQKSRKPASIYLEIRDACGVRSIFSMRVPTALFAPRLTLPAADPQC